MRGISKNHREISFVLIICLNSCKLRRYQVPCTQRNIPAAVHDISPWVLAASSRCNLCTRVMFGGCILQLFLEVNAIIFHSDMTVSSINKSRPALHHSSTVWKYHHGGCLLDSFQIFFFSFLALFAAKPIFFNTYPLFPSQMLSPVISASLAPEFGEQPTFFVGTGFHLGHDILPSCQKVQVCVLYTEPARRACVVLGIMALPLPSTSPLPWKHRPGTRVWVTSHCLGDISPAGGTAGLHGLNFIVLAASQC